jgi:transcription elongation factor Elf1
MSDVIQFSCPQCQGETFKVRAKVKRLEDFDGAGCTGCGRTITTEDVKDRAAQIAHKLILDALKR